MAVLTPAYDAEMSIFDATGRLVYHKSFNELFYKFNINISSLDKGLYIVSLVADNELYYAKFVKEQPRKLRNK